MIHERIAVALAGCYAARFGGPTGASFSILAADHRYRSAPTRDAPEGGAR